jgi:catechol 2,3-dioxygenase-like lactoylglutathione lyase family enzyme
VIDHVTIRVSDRPAAEPVYSALLATLGIEATHSGDAYAEWDDLSLAQADAEHPPTRRLHLGFKAPSRTHVETFWRAGLAAGWRDDGEPGERPQYTEGYYGAFLLDPDGNSVEAVHHDAMRPGGNVDHLWIRVRDLEAARRFYETVASHVGLRVGGREHPERFHVRSPRGGSFALVAGAPSEHVHLAFPAASRADVQAFHAAALGAGYRDHGAPGERPEYHPGYFAAYVLDPDGHNVEAVDHGR